MEKVSQPGMLKVEKSEMIMCESGDFERQISHMLIRKAD